MADFSNLENEGKEKAREEVDQRLGGNNQQNQQPNDPNNTDQAQQQPQQPEQ